MSDLVGNHIVGFLTRRLKCQLKYSFSFKKFIFFTNLLVYLSHIMRKPTSCISENKGADQLCSNCAFVFATQIN